MDVWFVGLKGIPGEIGGKNMVRPLFLLKRFFSLVEILENVLGVGFLAFVDWEGQASWASSLLPLSFCC